MNDQTIKEDKKMENGINGEKQVDEFFKVMHAHYTVKYVQSSI